MYRVSTQMTYSQSIKYINSKLSSLTELNEQSATQKRINKPSDDPVGSATVLNLRTALSSMDQYETNVDTAEGWLSTSDSSLTSVTTLLTRLKELAEEGATGTMTAENRTQISYEARQIYQQLISLANTKYQNKSIYAGQNTEENAFTECLWMTSNDASLSTSNSFMIEGSSSTTVLVQFLNSNVGTGASALMSSCDVRYSIDGGTTFLNGSVTSNGSGAMVVSMPESGTSITFAKDSMVKANSMTDTNNTSGSWMWIRPSAVYNGDDDDDTATTVKSMGTGTSLVSATARGSFTGNTVVRIDNDTAMDGNIEYSYSYDNGLNWVTGNTVNADASAGTTTLNIANGGLLTLTSNGSNALKAGSQFVITPNTADVNIQVSASEKIRVNDVGKDIFGGIYQDPQKVLANGGERLTLSSSNASAVFSSASSIYTSNGGNATKNLFETVGNLVAFLETNNQQGVSQCLESIKLTQTTITTALASVGGRENRLETTATILGNLKDSTNAQLSSVEDVDLTKLLTRLSQEETAYQAVLKSSSQIMQLSLMNYI